MIPLQTHSIHSEMASLMTPTVFGQVPSKSSISQALSKQFFVLKSFKNAKKLLQNSAKMFFLTLHQNAGRVFIPRKKQDRFTTCFKNLWNNPLWVLALQKKKSDS